MPKFNKERRLGECLIPTIKSPADFGCFVKVKGDKKRRERLDTTSFRKKKNGADRGGENRSPHVSGGNTGDTFFSKLKLFEKKKLDLDEDIDLKQDPEFKDILGDMPLPVYEAAPLSVNERLRNLSKEEKKSLLEIKNKKKQEAAISRSLERDKARARVKSARRQVRQIEFTPQQKKEKFLAAARRENPDAKFGVALKHENAKRKKAIEKKEREVRKQFSLLSIEEKRKKREKKKSEKIITLQSYEEDSNADPEVDEIISLLGATDFRSYFREKSSEFYALDTILTMGDTITKFFKDNPGIKEFLLPLITYAVQISRASSVVDVTAACVAYLNSTCWSNENVVVSGITIALHSVKDLAVLLWNLRKSDEIKHPESSIETEGGAEFFGASASFLSSLWNGRILTVMKHIFLSICGQKLLPRKLAEAASGWMGALPKMSFIDFLINILRLISDLFRMAGEVWNGAPVSEIFLSPTPVTRAIAEGNELVYYSDKTYPGLPVEGRICIKEYQSRAREFMEVSAYLLKEISPISGEAITLNRLRSSIGAALLDIEQRNKGHARPFPFGICLFGDPGIGKSRILPMLLAIHSYCKGRKFEMRHVFHRNMASDYIDTYMPGSHRYFHYSEAGSTAEPIAKMKGEPIMMEINSFLDTIPVTVNVAFEGKGKIFLDIDGIIADCNNSWMNMQHTSNNYAAFFRRFLFIEPKVKPQYRLDNGTGLDINKSLADTTTDIRDRWTYNAFRRVPDGPKSFKVVPVFQAKDLRELVTHMTKFFRDHIAAQEASQDKFGDELDVGAMFKNWEEDDHWSPGFLNNLQDPHITTQSGPDPTFLQYVVPYIILALRLLCGGLSFLFWTLISFLITSGLLGDAFGLWRKLASCFSLSGVEQWIYSFVDDKASKFSRFCINKVSDEFVNGDHTQIEDKLLESIERMSQKAVDRATSRVSRAWRASAPFWIETSYAAKISAGFLLLSSILTATYLVYRKSKQKKTFSSQAGIFEYYVDEGDVIPEDCKVFKPSPRRVKVRTTGHWNVIQNEISHYPSKATLDDFEKLVKRNVRVARVVNGSNSVRTHILGVKSCFAVVNTHSLAGDAIPEVHVAGNGDIDTCTSFRRSLITKSCRVDLPNDISVIALSNERFRDISAHILSGELVQQEYRGRFKDVPVCVGQIFSPRRFENKRHAPFELPKVLYYNYPQHYGGLCGYPLVIEGAGNLVAGIHIGGVAGQPEGYATYLDGKSIDEACESLTESFGELASLQPLTTQSLEDPAPKSPFCYEDMHRIEYYGKEPGPILVNKKSKLKKTGDSGFVRETLLDQLGWVPTEEYAPPVMKPFSRDGEYISPYNIMLRNVGKERPALNQEILKECEDEIIEHVRSKLPNVELHPISPKEAINGALQDEYLSRINVSTSAGHGYEGTKADHLPLDPECPLGITRKMTDRVYKEVWSRIHMYLKGLSGGVIFGAQLKDEPRTIPKVKAGKTRVFCMTPLPFLILCRMFLSPLYTLMVQFCAAFCCAIGIDMHRNCGEIYQALSRFPLTNCMEGDYSTFDALMPFEVGLSSLRTTSRLLRAMGYSRAHRKVVCGLMADCLFPHISMNKDVFLAPGHQPSGKLGTAEDNCIRNLTMLVYAWKHTEFGRTHKFFDHVEPCTYGDDMIASVSDEAAPFFNNVIYAELCMRLYGIKFTPACKEGELQPFLMFTEISFLKRKFVFREDLGRWTAPLDKNSLFRMLEWRLPSSTVSELHQVMGTVDSFARELFFHTNEEKFSEVRRLFVHYYGQKYGVSFEKSFPSWVDIKESL